MSGWRIQLLGNTVVHLGDDLSVTVSDPFARALLAYLALERETQHRRRDLIALLWPDIPPSKASDQLQATLKLLANALSSPYSHRPVLDHTRFRVSLRLDDDGVIDIEQFKHATVVSDRHPHTSLSACLSCQAVLASAASLYQGDLVEGLQLPGSFFNNWLSDQRTELRDQALDVFWMLADVAFAQDQMDKAITYARKQLLLDPWYIPAHKQLLSALGESGYINEALTHYEALYPRYRAMFKRAPDAVLTAIYEQLKGGGKAKTVHPPIGGAETVCPDPLDAQRVPFPTVPIINVGREVETAQVQAWLADRSVRLVMLTGPGGIGKTHLALNAVQAVRGTFSNGVRYLPLLDYGQCSVEELNELVMQQLSGPEADDFEETAYDRDILMILDNAEVIREGLAGWVLDFLGNTHQIKLLICSQFPLDIPGKQLSLNTLPIPAHVDNSGAQSYASVRMFEAYAQAANPAFELTLSNIPAVVQICHAVAGLPLGIQLAAVWVSQFSPVQLANALARDLDTIISPNTTLPERQRSLRTLFTRTLSVLSGTECGVLLQTAVFEGDFDSDAAQNVIVGTWVGKSIEALVHYGLLLKTSENRYRLASTVHQYARELLADPAQLQQMGFCAEIGDVEKRHSRYYRGILQAHIDQWRKGRTSLQAIEQEIHNIRTGWEWLEQHPGEPILLSQLESWLTYLKFSGDVERGIQTCDKLAWHLDHHLPTSESDPGFASARQRTITRLDIARIAFLISAGSYTEVDEILARTVQRVNDTGDIQLRAMFYLSWGEFFALRGDYPAAQEHFSQAWTTALELASPELTASNLLALGSVSLMQNNEEMAQTYFEQALDVARSSRWRSIECEVLCAFGQWHMFHGNYGQAQAHLDQAWQLAQDLGAPWLYPVVQLQLGVLSQRLGKLDDARSWFELALSLSREHHHRILEVQGLIALAALFYDQHDYEAALQTAQQAVEAAHSTGLRAEQAHAMLVAARVLEAQHSIDYALAAYNRVLPIYQDLEKNDELPVVYAGLARCEQVRGHQEQAQRRVERIVHRLRNKGRLLAIHEPMHIYCTCYDILVQDNPPRAVTVLRTAYNEMQQQAKSIRDPLTRVSFLNKVAANLDIAHRMQLYERQR